MLANHRDIDWHWERDLIEMRLAQEFSAKCCQHRARDILEYRVKY